MLEIKKAIAMFNGFENANKIIQIGINNYSDFYIYTSGTVQSVNKNGNFLIINFISEYENDSFDIEIPIEFFDENFIVNEFEPNKEQIKIQEKNKKQLKIRMLKLDIIEIEKVIYRLKQIRNNIINDNKKETIKTLYKNINQIKDEINNLK